MTHTKSLRPSCSFILSSYIVSEERRREKSSSSVQEVEEIRRPGVWLALGLGGGQGREGNAGKG